MKYLPLTLMLLAPVSAHAFTTSQTGVWFDGHAGLAVGSSPVKAGFGYRASAGVWVGNYDRAYALGRSWGVGASFQHHLGRHIAPMLEVRRHIDLLVVGIRLRAMAGPEWADDKLGGTLRIGGGIKVRPSPYVGPTIDLEGGASYIDGKVSPRIGLNLGVEFTIPTGGRKPSH